ncbi:5'/3'-nucleotidase SurE [Schleiferia thermophila]|jgi:5'-nucleotidase|uniref:5'-nucleotidase SurE n=1 Tax=Schleiferia thermophila TaxID=884107 RepID=A0A369A776_9FLAO|nr:5'/3'-nucleotidase SurE [Schleiferia thermophila]KFD38598.1 stationary phase survival protein SurE [Schleiferia thermophila str. Yellowstone]RCX05200.1 5'-nucleotidase /3'-nucleotidase /exopolyphosphatase [Schleiferia thermophila]GCD79287.1 5'-nucleotidase SurE [Schleiferia thermophila]
MKRALILVCNDDGITAPGIRNLIKAVQNIGDVVVVAPDKPQSGMGHAITINSSLRCDPIKIDDGSQKEYACSGTPVDCVKLAVSYLLPRKPDLIVSGINHGSNSSINVIYSGTMSAAVEGALENIPSIGFSLLDYAWEADFSKALRWVRVISKLVLKHGLPKGICLNVNIPKVINNQDYKGVKICRQAEAMWEEEIDVRKDPRGRNYFWLSGSFVNHDKGKDTDEYALENYFISVVPIKVDFTAYDQLKAMSKWNFEISRHTTKEALPKDF